MKRHIDWLSVDMVCQGSRMKLTTDERRMVIRRLSERMLTVRDYKDNYWSPSTAAKITASQLAERMYATERTIWRLHGELPPATKSTCPLCGESMWILGNGVVEEHPDRFYDPCPISGQGERTGLASIRPDLYAWLSEVSA